MSEPMRDLLERLAEDQPAVQVSPDVYARGRRAHRRGVALRVLGATAVVGVVVGLTGPLLEHEDAPPPASSDVRPAMPTRLFAVPERLAAPGEHGYTWHEELRFDDLALGPTAAVFPVNGGAVVAVSAVDGRYRGLDLPGFDESSYFRFRDAPVALSPDGTRLAWTWNPDVISGPGDAEVASGVRVADLRDGRITDVEIPSRYGVYAHGFGWSPDGRYLAYDLETVTAPDGEVRGSRNHRVGRLDTTTGRTVLTRLQGSESAPAVSDRGLVAVNGGGYNAIWTPDGDPEVRIYEGPYESVAWSPSGGRIGLASLTGQVAIGDARGMVLREVSELREDDGRVRVLGWPDESGFAIVDESSSTIDLVPADVEDRQVVVRSDSMPGLIQVSVATNLLAEPTRDTPAPDWPTDTGAVALRAALAAGVLLAVAALVAVRRRQT